MKKSIPFLSLFFGVTVLSLGIMGYQQANSLISLIVGGSLGLIVIFGSIFMLMEKKWAYFFTLGFTFLLGVFFAVRFSMKEDFLNGAMTLFSGIVLIMLVIEIYHFYAKGL